MKKISLEKKKTRLTFRPHLALTLLVGGMLTLVMTQAAQAQKYSDWSAAVNLGPAINSAFSDQGPAISKDGLSLYFTSDRPEGLGGPFDMYVSQRASVDDPWGSPVNLGPTVNTAFDEGEPGLSRDGHFLFFQSKRPGGFGGIDLWVSYREHTHDDFDWQPAVNLGAGVNSAADDQGPSYFENEEDGAPQLYFGSSRPGGLGGNSNRVGSIGAGDLWAATRESTLDAWSTPVNLGSPVNTSSQEQAPYLSSDGKTLFFSSGRPGGFGGLDLYVTTRTKLRGQSGN